MGKRVIVTGGSGKAGKHVIEYLIAKGHEVLNLDLTPLDGDLRRHVHTVKVDLTNTGDVYSVIMSHFRLTEPFHEPTSQIPDAVIHLAAHARNMLVPDNVTFKDNVTSTYNVIEACCRLGVQKIILASSICVYGVTSADGDVDFPSFPVDENVELNPMDAYAISKVCLEQVAAGFARRFGIDIYALRIGPVIAPNEYDRVFPNYVRNPAEFKAHGWSYVDARDLGQMCYRCVLTDGLGFQIFNATNDEITNNWCTQEFLLQHCPSTPILRKLGAREAPITNQKIKRLLGFNEEHNWRKYYKVHNSSTVKSQ